MTTRHPKVTKTCPICGESFQIYYCYKDRKTTCSRKCAGVVAARQYEAARLHLQCLQCGADFSAAQYRAKDARFCGRQCQNTFIARAYAQARGDAKRYSGEGKTYVKMHNRHMHRVVAEQSLGRPLERGEVVHHINENPRDNRPENLQVLPSQAEHARLHFTKNRKCSVDGCGRKHCAKGLCELHWKRNRSGYDGTRKVRLCSIEGCGRPHVAKGLCNMHWRRNDNAIKAAAKSQAD